MYIIGVCSCALHALLLLLLLCVVRHTHSQRGGVLFVISSIMYGMNQDAVAVV